MGNKGKRDTGTRRSVKFMWLSLCFAASGVMGANRWNSQVAQKEVLQAKECVGGTELEQLSSLLSCSTEFVQHCVWIQDSSDSPHSFPKCWGQVQFLVSFAVTMQCQSFARLTDPDLSFVSLGLRTPGANTSLRSTPTPAPHFVTTVGHCCMDSSIRGWNAIVSTLLKTGGSNRKGQLASS